MAIHINAQLQAAKAAPQHDKDDGPWLGGWSGSWRHTFVAALRAIFVPDELSSSRNIAKYCPLIAAVIAPMSTLMDIPALSVSRRAPLGRQPVQVVVTFSSSAIFWPKIGQTTVTHSLPTRESS